jgi:hypothetical protein
MYLCDVQAVEPEHPAAAERLPHFYFHAVVGVPHQQSSMALPGSDVPPLLVFLTNKVARACRAPLTGLF